MTGSRRKRTRPLAIGNLASWEFRKGNENQWKRNADRRRACAAGSIRIVFITPLRRAVLLGKGARASVVRPFKSIGTLKGQPTAFGPTTTARDAAAGVNLNGSPRQPELLAWHECSPAGVIDWCAACSGPP